MPGALGGFRTRVTVGPTGPGLDPWLAPLDGEPASRAPGRSSGREVLDRGQLGALLGVPRRQRGVERRGLFWRPTPCRSLRRRPLSDPQLRPLICVARAV